MFKYLSNILSTITPGQRLIALCVLLFSIVIITTAPKLIDATTKDTEELTNKINLQRTEIAGLSEQVQKLNEQLIANSSECTNRLISKQKEILTVIDALESDLAPKPQLRRESAYRRISSENDSTVMMMQMPRMESPEPVPANNSAALKKLKNLKLNLSKDIQKSQN